MRVNRRIPPASFRGTSMDRRAFLIAGEVELSLIGAGGIDSDPDYMREVYASSTERAQHAQGYRNDEFDRLAEEQLATLDREERMPIVARMQEIVSEDLPLLYPDSVHIFDHDVFDQCTSPPAASPNACQRPTTARCSRQAR